MLISNKQLLKKMNKDLLFKIENHIEEDCIIRLKAKNGSPTLAVKQNEKVQYIHSSYNPEREGTSIIDNLNIDNGSPIIFLGMGLGYHLQKIVESVNPKYFYIIEIVPDVLKVALETLQLTDSIYKNLENIFLATSNNQIHEVFKHILEKSSTPPTLVILPSYQTIYSEEINQFLSVYKDLVTNNYDKIASDYNFQKLWGLNSLNNFPTILETPNLFLDIDTEQFKGKPAIIVGAGPSLTKEIDNLKKIQEEKSAFIFAVGSAINALIEYGIRPNAIIAYDPKKENVRVFEKIRERNIIDIPLLFGSTIGTESLKDYPGPRIHFFLNQDYLNPFLLSCDEYKNIKIINDGPTVTVVALDLLSQLKSDPIILIGQNLSFEKNVRYAKGIQYKHGSSGGNTAPSKDYYVMSVTGEELRSSKEFILAKNSIENFLEQNPVINVINCTQNGAQIKYTSFTPLETVMSAFKSGILNEQIIIDVKERYDREPVLRRAREIFEESEDFSNALQIILETIKRMDHLVKQRNDNKINTIFYELDRAVHGVTNMNYYKTLIGPMTRIYFEKTAKEIQFIKQINNPFVKARKICKEFNNLVYQWSVTHNELSLSIVKLKNV